ncbi:MAG: DUF3299 domain-containing protein [Verrucomicrobia bacterium]|nr:DUF3299 domain-containing protein [Verrucomicrobiota bacterium]
MKAPSRLLLPFLTAAALAAAAWAAEPAGPDAFANPNLPAPYPAPAVTAQPPAENGYLKLGFDQLSSYVFTPPAFDPAADPNVKPPTGEEQIPPIVKSWHGKKAVVTGYMVPVKMEKGLVVEFLLMRNTLACCFGMVPNMNEWVIVKMKQGVAPLMDVPVSFYGQLKVGAMFEYGYMTGLYELEAERMGEVQG